MVLAIVVILSVLAIISAGSYSIGYGLIRDRVGYITLGFTISGVGYLFLANIYPESNLTSTANWIGGLCLSAAFIVAAGPGDKEADHD